MTYLHTEKTIVKQALLSKNRQRLVFNLLWLLIFVPAVFRGMPQWAKVFFMMSGITSGFVATFTNDRDEENNAEMMLRNIKKVEIELVKDKMRGVYTIADMEQENKLEQDKMKVKIGMLNQIIHSDFSTDLKVILLDQAGLGDFARLIVAEEKNHPILPSITVQSEPVEDLTQYFREEVAAKKAAGIVDLPYDLKLESPSILNDITRFPTIVIPHPQGFGKTGSICDIFSHLDGYKVISTPKPLQPPAQGIFDLIYGYDRSTNQWAFTGNLDQPQIKNQNRDLSSYLAQAKEDPKMKFAGSVVECVHASYQESLNRQRRNEVGESFHVFLDEASKFYIAGGTRIELPLEDQRKYEPNFKTWVEQRNKAAFMDYRSQKVQVFFAAQTRTLDSLGLQGFGKTLDRSWELHPGTAAIDEAEALGLPLLADWLRNRVKQGYGIAILTRDGKDIIVLDMSRLDVLSSYSDRQDSKVVLLSKQQEYSPEKLQEIKAIKGGLEEFVKWSAQQRNNITDSQIERAVAVFFRIESNPEMIRMLREKYIGNTLTDEGIPT